MDSIQVLKYSTRENYIACINKFEKFGNRHAKFTNFEWLDVHWDKYNATSFPMGTVNHLAKWGNEKTGISEDILRVAGWGTLAAIGIKLLQKL